MLTPIKNNYIREDIKVVLSRKALSKIDRMLISLKVEVGFYGLVETYREGSITYYKITDIILYPQNVTGGTINTDELEMVNFFLENAHRIRNIRYHGHSHVSLPAVPSSVDIEHMKGMVSSLPKDDFYIFQIFNKHNRISTIVYIDGEYVQAGCLRETDEDIDYSLIRPVSGSTIFNTSEGYVSPAIDKPAAAEKKKLFKFFYPKRRSTNKSDIIL